VAVFSPLAITSDVDLPSTAYELRLEPEGNFKGIDLQPRFEGFDFEDYNFDNAWEITGEYNWKGHSSIGEIVRGGSLQPTGNHLGCGFAIHGI
jgi:hypothetical protein